MLGPNGAGKTTLLRVIAGISAPSSGEVLIPASGPRGHRRERARQVGYVAHQSMLYMDLTAEENLRFFGMLYGLSRHEASGRAMELVGAMGIAEHCQVPVRELSQGQRKRISIARAMMHDPPVLLLDEPFSALDTTARAWLGDLLARTSNKVLLLATHQPDQDLPSADRVLVLTNGALCSDQTSVPRSDPGMSGSFKPEAEE